VRLRWLGRNRRLQGLVAELSVASGSVRDVVVELRRGRAVVARSVIDSLGTRTRRAVLHELHHRRGHLVPDGRYTLLVLAGGRTLLRRSVRVPR
jgi:hypothetical protein